MSLLVLLVRSVFGVVVDTCIVVFAAIICCCSVVCVVVVVVVVVVVYYVVVVAGVVAHIRYCGGFAVYVASFVDGIVRYHVG